MDIRLTDDDLALQRKARAFTDEVLVPLELECEWNDGLTPDGAADFTRFTPGLLSVLAMKLAGIETEGGWGGEPRH